MLGPLLHRTGEAFVPLVGGDPIGQRPVDFHVAALRALGAEVETGPAGITARASRLYGARIDLPYPSVGATETVLLTAVLAEGKTVLRNAATEPEVVELALFLQRMGAHIELSPDRRIVIEGVPRLRGASRWLAGDRLEAFSYLVAGLITGGEVRVHGCPQDRLVTAITTLARMGAQLDITDEWITASAPSGLRPKPRKHRHPPRVHDRLAAAADGAVHPGRRDVGAARDGVREPARVRARAAENGLRDRGVRGLPWAAPRAVSTTRTRCIRP